MRTQRAETRVRRQCLWMVVATGVWVVALGSGPALAGVVRLEGNVLDYASNPGEREQDLAIHLRQGAVRVTRAGELSLGPGCDYADQEGDDVVRCPIAPGSPRPRLRVHLGDGSDHFRSSGFGGVVDGGGGEDDIWTGGLPMRVFGGSGNDTLHGVGRLYGGPGDDAMDAEYADRTMLVGGGGNDELLGNRGPNRLLGGRGDDHHEGEGGPDVLDGGLGDDTMWAGGGDDLVRARDGIYEELECGGGDDTVVLDDRDFYKYGCEHVRRQGLAHAMLTSATVYLYSAEDVPANTLEVTYTCPHDGPSPCAPLVVVRDRRGTVLRDRDFWGFRLGELYFQARLPRRAILRIHRWAHITLWSRDRAGGLHRQTMTGAIPKWESDYDSARAAPRSW
jgi:RTX calcium-binding nonapeptide repeat (4 copies)